MRDALPSDENQLLRLFVETDENQLLRLFVETRDPVVREEVIHRLLPLARSLALRYRGSTEDLDDLMQVAYLGLVKALDNFDPERGESFVAYAAPTILGELRRHFRDRVWNLRLPRALQERTMAVQDAARKLSDELGRTPSASQIAQHLELSEEEVAEALQADQAHRTLSLDAPSRSDDAESAPMLETMSRVEPGFESVETQLAANRAEVSSIEMNVLWMRFEDDLTQREIGDRIGVSQMQVSRIMRSALRKLLEAVE